MPRPHAAIKDMKVCLGQNSKKTPKIKQPAFISLGSFKKPYPQSNSSIKPAWRV